LRRRCLLPNYFGLCLINELFKSYSSLCQVTQKVNFEQNFKKAVVVVVMTVLVAPITAETAAATGVCDDNV